MQTFLNYTIFKEMEDKTLLDILVEDLACNKSDDEIRLHINKLTEVSHPLKGGFRM